MKGYYMKKMMHKLAQSCFVWNNSFAS